MYHADIIVDLNLNAKV